MRETVDRLYIAFDVREEVIRFNSILREAKGNEIQLNLGEVMEMAISAILEAPGDFDCARVESLIDASLDYYESYCLYEDSDRPFDFGNAVALVISFYESMFFRFERLVVRSKPDWFELHPEFPRARRSEDNITFDYHFDQEKLMIFIELTESIVIGNV